MPPQILSAGFVCADLLLRPVDVLPPAGGNRFVEQALLAIGGCAATAAINFARLGCQVAIAGRIGSDPLGQLVRAEFAAAGVDTSPLLDSAGVSTAINTALIGTTGERSFYVFPGACDLLTSADLPDGLLARFDHLHLGAVGAVPGLAGEQGAALVRRARALGLTISLDVTLNPPRDPVADILPLLPHVDLFLPNLEEAQAVLGESALDPLLDRGLALGLQLMGLKLGERGCVLATPAERLLVPALAVEVIDTSGAGDAWSAAAVVGWLAGWPLEEIGRTANAAGALCSQILGATAPALSLDAIQRLLQG